MSTNRNLTRKAKPLRTVALVLSWSSLAVLFSVAGAGCSHEAEGTGSGQQTETIVVATANPQRKDLIRKIDQPGYLRPYEMTPIFTKIAGFAEEPPVDIGDRVKKDSVLLDLYVPEVKTDVEVRKARVKQAEADLKQAKETAKSSYQAWVAAKADIKAAEAAIASADASVKRWEAEERRARELLLKGIYDKQTAEEQLNQLRSSQAFKMEKEAVLTACEARRDQASAYYNKAEADVEVAVANVDVAKANYQWGVDWLSYAKITAPYDGVITRRWVHKGQFLQPANSGSTTKMSEPLYIMMRTDIMRCETDVPELDAVLVRDGDKAIVHFQAMPGEETIGKVTRGSDSFDERSRTLRIEVWLKNPDNKFKPGMYANVTILAKVPNAWTLPTVAVMNDILRDKNSNFCFMVENGKACKTFLQMGAICDDDRQVLRKQRAGSTEWEAITGKEAVAVTNCGALTDGQTVQVKESQAR